ncbi:hypothetical protein PO124_17780 [Bacillus licheniformis]|nr:hypothetical protein [Bacillus licheniformis]
MEDMEMIISEAMEFNNPVQFLYLSRCQCLTDRKPERSFK